MENLPDNLDEPEIQTKISDLLREQFGKVYTWIDSSEGKIIANATVALSSFVAEGPWGVVIPIILECSDYAVRKRFVKHFPNVMEKIEKSKEKINQEFLQSDLGQKLLRDTLRQIIDEADETKIEAQKNFLLNSITATDPDHQKISAYQKILLSLESSQLQILRALYDAEKTIEKIMSNKDPSKPTISISLKKDFRELLEIDEILFERDLTKLESEKLVTFQTEEIPWKTGDYDWQYSKDVVQSMLHILNRILTDMGRTFVDYYQKHND